MSQFIFTAPESLANRFETVAKLVDGVDVNIISKNNEEFSEITFPTDGRVVVKLEASSHDALHNIHITARDLKMGLHPRRRYP